MASALAGLAYVVPPGAPGAASRNARAAKPLWSAEGTERHGNSPRRYRLRFVVTGRSRRPASRPPPGPGALSAPARTKRRRWRPRRAPYARSALHLYVGSVSERSVFYTRCCWARRAGRGGVAGGAGKLPARPRTVDNFEVEEERIETCLEAREVPDRNGESGAERYFGGPLGQPGSETKPALA